jgi:membrane-associated phospholipid phosphatase
MREMQKKNALIFLPGEILEKLEKRFGVSGLFSFKLIFGLVLGLASLFLFAKLSDELLEKELAIFDQSVTLAVRYFSSDGMTTIMRGISYMGSPTVLVIVGLLVILYVGYFRRHFWDASLVPIALIGGIILNTSLKNLFHRERPELLRLVEVSGLSYPSGHAMVSFVFFGMMIYLMWMNYQGRFGKIIFSLLFGLLILLIGISRIYLGVHYPSDVVAGFAAGSFWLVSCIFSLRGIKYYKAKRRK